MSAPTLDQITLADEPARWAALGFTIAGDECRLGMVGLRFNGSGSAFRPPESGVSGILGWSLRELASTELDGLPTASSQRPLPAAALEHPNGVVAIDHVVAFTPNLNRSIAALQTAGLDLRRVREQPTPAGAPRQAFFRLGAEILEVVQQPRDVIERLGGADRPARFWGLALLVDDIDRSAQEFAPHVSEVRAAVQPGRRIATLRRSAGLAVPVALISRREETE